MILNGIIRWGDWCIGYCASMWGSLPGVIGEGYSFDGTIWELILKFQQGNTDTPILQLQDRPM